MIDYPASGVGVPRDQTSKYRLNGHITIWQFNNRVIRGVRCRPCVVRYCSASFTFTVHTVANHHPSHTSRHDLLIALHLTKPDNPARVRFAAKQSTPGNTVSRPNASPSCTIKCSVHARRRTPRLWSSISVCGITTSRPRYRCPALAGPRGIRWVQSAWEVEVPVKMRRLWG